VSNQPTPEKLRVLTRQLRLVETLAWEHDADPSQVHDELARAYRVDRPAALRVMADIASSRLDELEVGDPGSPFRSIRGLFHTMATIDDHDLVGRCIDLVQACRGGQQRAALVEPLVSSGRGASALIELLSMAMITAHRLTETSEELNHPREVVAREAATGELTWLGDEPS
jgi:hypothetical protein